MIPSLLPLLALLSLLGQLYSVDAATGYSSFYTQTFPWNANTPVNPLYITSTGGTQAGVYSNVMQSSPFQSVYGRNVTVDAIGNLAFPFTGQYGSYQDIDTGIDVLAGGQITFYIPPGYTGGQWCFELGRAGAGTQYCSGPQGAWFTDPDPSAPSYLSNDKINGAYVSSDPLQPYYIDVTNTSLGLYNFATLSNGQPWAYTQYGTNRGYTWTRSGSVVFRIGARGSAVATSQYNFNEPTTDYDSALDSTDQNLHPPPTINSTSGLVGRTILTPISGRLWLACWRWNLWPMLNYGQTYVLINYTSPIALAASWSPATNANVGSASQPVILPSQPIPSPLIMLPDNFTNGASVSTNLKALLPVENITIANFAASQGVAPLLQSSFSWHYANVRSAPVAVGQPVASCCWGGLSFSFNYLTNQLTYYEGLFTTLVSYQGQLAFDMTHILDSNSTTPFLPSSKSNLPVSVLNMWYPQGQIGSYYADVDSGMSVLEGGTLTITSQVATWCFPTYRNNASQLCTDQRGAPSFSYYNTTQTYLQGCDNFLYIFPNASSYASASYGNIGCNSGSITNPRNGALLMRVGSNNQGHSPIDYAPVFTDFTQTGTLTATVRAPASGRLYFAAAVSWNANVASMAVKPLITQTSSYGVVYTGSQTVSVTYTPPTALSFAFSWSPSTAAANNPYTVAVPNSLSTSDLSAAGYTMVSASNGNGTTGLGVGASTQQYIYYVLPQTMVGSTFYTATFTAYTNLAEADTASNYIFTISPTGPNTPVIPPSNPTSPNSTTNAAHQTASAAHPAAVIGALLATVLLM